MMDLPIIPDPATVEIVPAPETVAEIVASFQRELNTLNALMRHPLETAIVAAALALGTDAVSEAD